MNSIRSFVSDIIRKSNRIVRDTADISELDSILLEHGFVNHAVLPKKTFYRGNRDKAGGINLAWVVTFEGRPFFISGFDIEPLCSKAKVILHLREIIIGRKLPDSIGKAKTELCLDLMHLESSIRLADCPIKTFDWLKTHKATQKVIERISRPA